VERNLCVRELGKAEDVSEEVLRELDAACSYAIRILMSDIVPYSLESSKNDQHG